MAVRKGIPIVAALSALATLVSGDAIASADPMLENPIGIRAGLTRSTVDDNEFFTPEEKFGAVATLFTWLPLNGLNLELGANFAQRGFRETLQSKTERHSLTYLGGHALVQVPVLRSWVVRPRIVGGIEVALLVKASFRDEVGSSKIQNLLPFNMFLVGGLGADVDLNGITALVDVRFEQGLFDLSFDVPYSTKPRGLSFLVGALY